ncbi:hypothetical protein AX16_007627 [Volvariella volvacea WC 439]|nr:hypothetical protein AX16_007627 [Volvariella volvacea WC 439]
MLSSNTKSSDTTTYSEHQLSSFESCPNEILSSIQVLLALNNSSSTYRKDILNLRLVSCRFNAFFTQFVLNTLSLSWISSDEYDGPTNRNPRITLGPPSALFVPTPDAFIPSLLWLNVSFSRDHLASLCTTKTPQEAVVHYSLFWTEVSRLTSLKYLNLEWGSQRREATLELEYCAKLSEMLFQTINNATNGGLEGLFISFPYWASVLESTKRFIASNPNLRKIGLSNKCEHPFCSEFRCRERGLSFNSMLGSIFRSVPGVREVILENHCSFPICSMEELLPADLGEVSLKELDIMASMPNRHPSTSISVPSATYLPPLRNLTSLSLCPRPSDFSPPVVDLDLFWAALRHCGARLSYLYLECGVSTSLMEYLSSYGGLKALDLRIYHPINIPPASTIFSHSVLPLHAPTIQILKLECPKCLSRPGFEALTLDTEAWPSITSFINLKTLTVHLPHDWHPEKATIQRCLDYLSPLPTLNRLSLRFSAPIQDGHGGSTELGWVSLLERVGRGSVVKSLTLNRVEVKYLKRSSVWSVVPDTQWRQGGRTLKFWYRAVD